MKKLALLILATSAFSFTSCQSLKEQVSAEDLEKAVQFAQCSQACYDSIYTDAPEVAAP